MYNLPALAKGFRHKLWPPGVIYICKHQRAAAAAGKKQKGAPTVRKYVERERGSCRSGLNFIYIYRMEEGPANEKSRALPYPFSGRVYIKGKNKTLYKAHLFIALFHAKNRV